MHRRRRLVRDHRLPGPEGARDPLRLLREGVDGRRQLAIRKRQRAVVRLPLAAHQQRPQADVLPRLPDAGGLPGLPEPLAGRQVLRRLRGALRPARGDHLQHRSRRRASRPTAEWEVTVRDGGRRARLGALPGGAGRQRAPLEPALARTAFPGARSSRASRSTSTTTASPTSLSASGCWSSGSATRPSTSPSSPRGSPTRPSSRCAAAPTSCPSSSAASRSTKPRRR